MPYETEPTPTRTAQGYEQEWANWWQGYWSDAPTPQPRPQQTHYPWRESAHEFDFGGGEQ